MKGAASLKNPFPRETSFSVEVCVLSSKRAEERKKKGEEEEEDEEEDHTLFCCEEVLKAVPCGS